MALGDSGDSVNEVIDALVPTEILDGGGNIIKPPPDMTSLTEEQIYYCQLKCTGKKDHEIRERMGITQNHLKRLKNDPVCQGWIEEFLTDSVESTRNKIRDATGKAFETLEALLLSPNDGVKLGAVKEILDRAGLKPVERKVITATMNVKSLSEDEIKERLLRLERGDQ